MSFTTAYETIEVKVKDNTTNFTIIDGIEWNIPVEQGCPPESENEAEFIVDTTKRMDYLSEKRDNFSTTVIEGVKRGEAETYLGYTDTFSHTFNLLYLLENKADVKKAMDESNNPGGLSHTLAAIVENIEIEENRIIQEVHDIDRRLYKIKYNFPPEALWCPVDNPERSLYWLDYEIKRLETILNLYPKESTSYCEDWDPDWNM
jgi:hypothetical protein